MNAETSVMNPLAQLRELGQSVWFDFIHRDLLTGGELERLIARDGLAGITSNPAIFRQAIAGNEAYADSLARITRDKTLDVQGVYEQLAIEDIRRATSLLTPVYEETAGRDGYVSLEVSPYLAHDTEGTIDEARRLWQAVDMRNLMIKVPATPAGLPAIEQLIGEGVNVNVTLLFSIEVYAQVVERYLNGIEIFGKRGGDPRQVASVASFFISRMDSAIDKLVATRLEQTGSDDERARLRRLLGEVAVANAKLAYQRYKQLHSGARWERLAAAGARSQRLLWASTSTKNPGYRDVLYIEPLIGPDTVNTIPPSTYEAFRDHGRARVTLEEDLDRARETLATLAGLDISIDAITDELLDQGVHLFAEAFNQLLASVATACGAPSRAIMKRQTFRLPGKLAAQVDQALDAWAGSGHSSRLWARDATLWTDSGEERWLGWLDAAADELGRLDGLRAIAEEVRQVGFTHALVLGMGGSSLCPEVLKLTFGKLEGFPELFVLDSTDPAQVKTFEQTLDLGRTLFIVASKSGSTLEPNVFMQYFRQRVRDVVGAGKAGPHFVAVTDPGSQLETLAERDRFRRVFHGVPEIGGRYSALSHFGMVPAAVMGIDCRRFLEQADAMGRACAACVPARDNPGVVLGVILGALGRGGRDKVTLIVSPGIAGLGAWLEQLIAESTGKQGKALIVVDAEKPAAPPVYGDDRVFVYLRLETAADARQDAAVAELERAGQPVIKISVADLYDLGQEFYRWEIATAVAGAQLGINPFDQPDVEASKLETRALTEEYERTGALPPETPAITGDGLALFTDARNAAVLSAAAGEAAGGNDAAAIAAWLAAHLDRLQSGDYFALLAYVEMSDSHRAELQRIRHTVRDAKRVATSLGFGPRFLHSTGQAFKGGPASGVFLQITCDDAADLAVPGQSYTFGVVKAAQARGDFQVLVERERRALRVHLGADVAAGLRRLRALVEQVLA